MRHPIEEFQRPFTDDEIDRDYAMADTMAHVLVLLVLMVAAGIWWVER
jgi:hypothetical protein